MRNISITPLLLACLVTSLVGCDRSTVVRKSISYKRNTLKVELYEKVDGRLLKDYKQEFDVAGLNKEERKALEKKVFDSLSGLPGIE